MPEPTPAASANAAPRRGRKRLLLAAAPVLLAGAGAAAWFLVPQVKTTVASFTHPTPAPAPAEAGKPLFVNLPEMTVTLPNGGQPRQMRIRLALELNANPGALQPTEALSPRVYDALLTYLRTLHDNELTGGLALDRMRGDLYRRLDLVLGSGNLRDVLITSLVVG